MFVFSFGEVDAAVLVIAPVCLLKSLKFGSALAHTHTLSLSLCIHAVTPGSAFPAPSCNTARPRDSPARPES